MDSLTQITLGAAVGEVVLGRKAGNKAMFWGAVGGTIPDLDVLANLASDELSALAYHRAISHSFTFAMLAPPLLGWAIYRIYQSADRRAAWRGLGIIWLALALLLSFGGLQLPIPPPKLIPIGATVSAGIVFLPAVVLAWRQWRRRPLLPATPGWKEWSWLFFWAIFTHPLLDSCTTYGTQLFQPFSNYRVGLNNISVADPAYTFPFLICVMVASRLTHHFHWRRTVNYLGIGLSCAYLLFTFINKLHVNQVFERSLAEQNIPYERYMTSPTILNNFLWQGVAEGDSVFYQGMYSILDREPRVKSFSTIPKHHEMLDPYRQHRSVRTLEWFSNGFYTVFRHEDGSLVLSDLRFGTFTPGVIDSTDFVFKFVLREKNGELTAHDAHRRSSENFGEAMRQLWERIKGI